MLLCPFSLPLNISQWQKVSLHANHLHECGLSTAESDVFGPWRTGQKIAEAKGEPVVRSFWCFLAIPHQSGWTNRLSELTSPWEHHTASLIHISVLFPNIPVIFPCTREKIGVRAALACPCFWFFLLICLVMTASLARTMPHLNDLLPITFAKNQSGQEAVITAKDMMVFVNRSPFSRILTDGWFIHSSSSCFCQNQAADE